MASMNPSDKPRLTDQEKKQNHIISEQKRRQAIREGFDRLAELVPGMEGQGRSEAVVLQATVQYMRETLTRKEELRREAVAKGLMTSDQFDVLYQVAREGKYGHPGYPGHPDYEREKAEREGTGAVKLEGQ